MSFAGLELGRVSRQTPRVVAAARSSAPAFADPLPDTGAAGIERGSGTLSLARLHGMLLWLVGFSGGFVIIEPAPYEFLVALAFLIFFATGLQLRPTHLPLLVLLLVYCIGYMIGVVPVLTSEGTLSWMVTSCYMSVTTLFFALVLCRDAERRLDMLLKGYVVAAVMVSIFGIITYFHLLPGSDSFIFAQRSKSTFKDPNVLGAFLILPAVLATQKMILGKPRESLVGGLTFTVIAIELLFAFSRGAWGSYGAAAAMMLIHAWLTSRSGLTRLRIVLFTAAGCAIFGLLIGAILTLPQVSDLFAERASLIQSYDAGRFGRFGRHILGAQMALEHPIGIGPLQFTKYFPEDPHNSFLDSFLAGGWISGSVYLTLILTTLVIGVRSAFVATPWRPAYAAACASFIALTGESYIIDVQHWRHYFLLIGIIWGLFAATRRLRMERSFERLLAPLMPAPAAKALRVLKMEPAPAIGGEHRARHREEDESAYHAEPRAHLPRIEILRLNAEPIEQLPPAARHRDSRH